MFDLEAYSKRIGSAIGVEQLLGVFLESMRFIGFNVSSFRLQQTGGKQCSSAGTSNQSLKCLINSDPTLVGNPVLRASVLARARVQRGTFLFNASQDSVLATCPADTSLTDLCISLEGDDGFLAIIEAELGLSSNPPNEQLLSLAESIADVCFKRYLVINSDLVQLTGREVQILQLASIGETKRSIADDLGVTNHAVDFHYRNIMKKYKTNKIVVAVAQAIRTGVI